MGDKKYRAFISYSHADEAWGGWLQRTLEGFRTPGALAAALEAQGRSARLAPVFRDREDLPVAGNLNSAIQAALSDSDFQIVLCSPNSARSRWVNEEIRLFHKLHGPDRVFALIIAGEPNATSIAGREDEECFPPALRFILDSEGNLTGTPAEPLAADARKDGDGRRYAVLKVAAGVLGVGLDDLVRRDASRRARQASTVAGVSLIGMAATAALAFYAIAKGNEATRMRAEAENLIEFMLTELKEELEPVGRLDVLESVSARALAYYADQDPRTLDDDALARRAKAMMQLGATEDQRNNFDAALAWFSTAAAATKTLLDRAPNNANRIFDHAQSEFYAGDAALKRRDLASAEQKMRNYLQLADRLVSIDPENRDWRLERAYATSNLGIVKFEAGEFKSAIEQFSQSIETRRLLTEAAPDDQALRIAYAYSISWRALAEMELGNFRDAIGLIDRQLALYGDLAKPTSENFTVLDYAATAKYRLAQSRLWLGDVAAAEREIDGARVIADRLLAREKSNGIWIYSASYIERLQSLIDRARGDLQASAAAADKAIAIVKGMANKNDAGLFYEKSLAAALIARLSVGDQYEALDDDAAALAKIMDDLENRDILDTAALVAGGALELSRLEDRRGRIESADALVREAADRLEPIADKLSVGARLNLAGLYVESGERGKAAPILEEFAARGFSHPDIQALAARLELIARN